MNIILPGDTNESTDDSGMRRPGEKFLPQGALLLAAALLILAGYMIGRLTTTNLPRPGEEGLAQSVAGKLVDVEESRRTVELHLDALALRLGQMQARLIRLDALGQRLLQMAQMDDGEFDFNTVPARGGSSDASSPGAFSPSEFVRDLEQLSRKLEDRERQLAVMETLLMNRNVNEQVLPAGRPVLKGWTSSYFGSRRDPFNGRREFHRGIDLAGRQGTEIVAVAAGVVTYSEERAGYGNLVEIDHGNGYITRYAHNERNLVRAGERVARGQVVALMGSSGRSTGPHVHFEVLRNGNPVNPVGYIKSGG